jgi:hypothetical protein
VKRNLKIHGVAAPRQLSVYFENGTAKGAKWTKEISGTRRVGIAQNASVCHRRDGRKGRGVAKTGLAWFVPAMNRCLHTKCGLTQFIVGVLTVFLVTLAMQKPSLTLAQSFGERYWW